MPRKSAAAAGFAIIPGTPRRLHAPSELSAEERKIFANLVASCKPEHFRDSDTPLLVAYVRAVVMERRAATVLNKGDSKASARLMQAALSRWSQATKAMVALSLRLRLSPQSRAPNNPTRPQAVQRPTSYYDRAHLDGDADA
jgi:hypothetical protein